MGEIKVGEYIRTTSGDIGKLIRVELDEIDGFLKWYVYDNKRDYEPCTNKPYITNHSPNIIDLIEVGDYVNGELISNVNKVDNMNIIEWSNGDIYKTDIQNDKFIKSIVTHEQFNSIKYEVE